MSEKQAQDDAAKQRIISHMNRDHHDSVVRYLEHFGKVSSMAAFDGELTDIDLNGMTLSCQGKSYRIPIQPPMSSYAQARERVVDLDKEARKALGRSDVTVKKFDPPTGINAILSVGALITYAAFSGRSWFAPGQIVEQYLGSGVASFSWKIQPWFLPSLFFVHVLEAAVFAATKLKKHSVHPKTSTFWVWIADVIVEGIFSTKRFDAFIKAEREKQKH